MVRDHGSLGSKVRPFAPSWEHGSRIAGNARVRPRVRFSFTRPRPGHPPHRQGDCSLPRGSVMVRVDQPVVARPKGGRLSADTAWTPQRGLDSSGRTPPIGGLLQTVAQPRHKRLTGFPVKQYGRLFWTRCARRGRPFRERLKGALAPLRNGEKSQ